MRKLIAIAGVLALVAISCKIETNAGAIINADGTGTIFVEIGMDEEAQGFFLTDGVDPFEDSDFADTPDATFREETRGDLLFFITEIPVSSEAEMRQFLTEGDDSLLTDFNLTITDTLISISGTASPDDAFGEDTEGFDPQVLEDSLSASVFLTLPGEILSHNADRTDGNTLFWEVPLFGGDLTIQAESDPTGSSSGGGGGFPIGIVIAIAAVVVLGGLWYYNNQKKGDAAPAQAAPAATSTDDAPPPPPPAE